MKKLLKALVRAYQRWISPLKPATCRYYPTCSQYALQALERFGALRGSFLAIRRILRCHPFRPGGLDPVPEEFHFFRGHAATTPQKEKAGSPDSENLS